ncbi:MAG TPA: hypothetical protein VIN06_00495 [Devosia sp.]
MKLFRTSRTLVACVACGAGIVQAVTQGPRQSDASFAAAIRNQSTAPSYVLITEIDGNTGKSRQACVTANLLMGAIYRENELADDAEGRMTALHIALTTPDHVFTFTRRDALENIPHAYSDDQLSEVRAALKSLSTAQLLDAARRETALNSINAMPHEARRDATACVLIERGLSPGMGDISDQIWVRP